MIGNQTIKVEEASSAITAIERLEWLDDVRVVVICQINPSLGYLTIYNVENKSFEFSLYGTNFVWIDNNLRTLLYVEAPPESTEDQDAVYRIHDYFGETLYETPSDIKDLRYEDGTAHFNLVDKTGKSTPKTLSK